MRDGRRLVEREVRVDDPDLSPEANRQLTHELREAVGSDRVQVPADRADDLDRVPAAGHGSFGSTLASNRALIAITFAATDQPRGAAEVMSSGNNRVDVEPGDDPHRAGLQQRSAMTPAGSPVGPAEKGAPAVLPLVAVVGSVVVAIAVAVALGGVAWVLAAVVGAAGLAWLALAGGMRGRRDAAQGADAGPDRAVGDSATGRRRRLLPTALLLVAGVVAGVIVAGLVAGFL